MQRSGQLRTAIQKYPHIQSLHLYRVSLYFSQFENMGKLPNLRDMALLQLRSAEKADQPLLEGCRGTRRSAFQFLHNLTSLELGGHRRAAVTLDEFQGVSQLTNLQHITVKQLQPNNVPYSILVRLTSLTSLEVDQLELGISQLTRLQSLSFLAPFAPFPNCFSALQALTALKAGSNLEDYGAMSYKDLPSLQVFSNLQKLTLTGLVGTDYDIHKKAKGWVVLTSITSLKHLELRDVCHTYGTLINVAWMTQLTCLNLVPSRMDRVDLGELNQTLAALSTLTNLELLKCHFSFYQRYQDDNHVEDLLPVPDVGIALKAALPQATYMLVFAVESERLQQYKDQHNDCDYGGWLPFDRDEENFTDIKEYWPPWPPVSVTG